MLRDDPGADQLAMVPSDLHQVGFELVDVALLQGIDLFLVVLEDVAQVAHLLLAEVEGLDHALLVGGERPGLPGRVALEGEQDAGSEAGAERGHAEHDDPEELRSHRRSEERRVGKECRSRWSTYHKKKTMKA